MNNTVTTKDLAQLAAVRRAASLPTTDAYAAYDFQGAGWPVSAYNLNENPVASWGLSGVRTSRREEGFGDGMGAVRTSRREAGFGNLLGQLEFLTETKVLGIPLWILGAAAVAAFVYPGFLKKK